MQEDLNTSVYDRMIDTMNMEELRHWAKVGLITTHALFAKSAAAIIKILEERKKENGK